MKIDLRDRTYQRMFSITEVSKSFPNMINLSWFRLFKCRDSAPTNDISNQMMLLEYKQY